MTPYTKKIVELHKIHKAIEDKDCNGGGNTPSSDITIDDVVKFIHDEVEKVTPGDFPYTTWNDIPNYENVSVGQICKTDDVSGKNFHMTVLLTSSYIIGIKGRQIG